MRTIKKNISIALLISMGISMLIHFPGYFEHLSFGKTSFKEPGETLSEFLFELGITFLVSFLLFVLNLFIGNRFNKTAKTRFWIAVSAILITFVSVFVLSSFLFSLKHTLFQTVSHARHGSHFMFENLLVAAVVLVCTYIIQLAVQKQNVELENEQLRRESLQAQYQTLKNQVSPHFLFNSLNALQTLIRESPEIAQKYVSHLSNVLRYTLQSNENQTVSLADEMKYVESYLFLVQLRYDTNLAVDFAIPDKAKILRLPPLTIQLLLENAIKHNEISKRKPLKVSVYVKSEDVLVVSNPIQQKIRKEDGAGIGLYNLSKHYQLISGKEIEISRENECFTVEVPLLNATAL